jgi:hypothetical protein
VVDIIKVHSCRRISGHEFDAISNAEGGSGSQVKNRMRFMDKVLAMLDPHGAETTDHFRRRPVNSG